MALKYRSVDIKRAVALWFRRQFDPGDSRSQRHDPCVSLRRQRVPWPIVSGLDLAGLLNMQARCRRERRGRGKAHTHRTGLGVNLDSLEIPRVQREPQTERSYVNPRSEGIQRSDLDDVAFRLDVAAQCQPSELRVIHNVGCSVPCVAKEVWAI